MKQGRNFILRGSFTMPIVGTYNEHLIVDDGIPQFGYRVKSFKIVPQSYEGQAVMFPDALAFLTTSLDTTSRFMFDEPAQIAWAMFDNTSGSGIESDPSFMLIDDQVFVRDLYFRGWVAPASAGTADYNYFIEIERVKLSDIEALVYLATEVNS